METVQQASTTIDLATANEALATLSAEDRIAWAHERFGASLILTTSFGAQSAVMLALASRAVPGIPVVFIDTGYLFAETYRFADELSLRLKLNLKVYRPAMSPGWLEARHGRLWEQGLSGIESYNRIAKVEPMRRALRELAVQAWLAGLRRTQSESRDKLPVVGLQDGIVKIHPIVDWSDRDVHRFLERNGLPYHPLWEQGYVSIGDVHTSRPLTADLTPEQTRFFGLKRECGMHEPSTGGAGI